MTYYGIDKGIMDEIERITGVNYNKVGNLIDLDCMENILEDLLSKISNLQEQLDNEIQDKEENWVRVNTASQYDIDDRDFI